MTAYSFHGNLMSYKVYLRPTARHLYGHSTMVCTKHQKNIQNILHILFVNGAGTTWDMAKADLRKIDHIRKQEKMFRRLLVGRYDRGRRSKGVVDMGLVVKEKSMGKPYSMYRLSIHGILYYIDAFDPSHKEIDSMASKYVAIIPKVFGRWAQIKKILGPDAYNIKILAKGLYLNNITLANRDNPLYELMSYIHIKYRRNFEIIKEENLADQTSYWFYTFLLYGGKVDKLKKLMAQDDFIREWYIKFFHQATDYYEKRLLTLNGSRHIFK